MAVKGCVVLEHTVSENHDESMHSYTLSGGLAQRCTQMGINVSKIIVEKIVNYLKNLDKREMFTM